MTPKPKILIVDDIAEYAMAFEMYLPDDAEPLRASSAEEAKTLLAGRGAADLAIVDVRLDSSREGDTSGMELLSWMRKNYPQMPVIMVSAYQTFEYEVEALERGAFRFLKKPLQPVEVKAALKEVPLS
ncbi:MAG: response regulator [Lentisphaerae bacterium]|nr:response regulator [Lentisphaerota bacterium]